MANGQVQLDAEVVAELPLRRFLVSLGDGTELTAVVSRRVVGRKEHPRIQVGDRVAVERSPYDPVMCRIVGFQISRRTRRCT
jgi:translation initiation factor IF-1